MFFLQHVKRQRNLREILRWAALNELFMLKISGEFLRWEVSQIILCKLEGGGGLGSIRLGICAE